jgi:uncharacterized protein
MPDRFVTDSSLELLARRLRLLGFDVECLSGAPLEAVFGRARASERVVLTLSSRHPRRFASIPAFRVPREPRAALRAVVERFVPESRALSRCSACNAPLVTRPASSAPATVPERVRETATTLEHCEACGRWYWPGTHVAKMREWIAAAMVGSPRKPMIE